MVVAMDHLVQEEVTVATGHEQNSPSLSTRISLPVCSCAFGARANTEATACGSCFVNLMSFTAMC